MLEKPRASSTPIVGGHLSGTGKVTPRPDSFRTVILRCARPRGRPASSVTDPRTSSDDAEARAVATMLAVPRTFKGAELSAIACGVTNNVLHTAANIRTAVRMNLRVSQTRRLSLHERFT